MGTLDLESEQLGYPSTERHRLTEEETSWLEENGGSGEGIILCLFPVTGRQCDDLSKLVSDDSGLDYRVGEKTNISIKYSPEGCPLESLLVKANTDFKKNWPQFLVPLSISPPHVALLARLHVSDLLEIDFSENFLWARAFSTIDFLKTIVPPELDEMFKDNLPLPGRNVVVETILRGKRTLRVAEDWQNRLRQVMPFRFRNWDEVLDVIEKK